MSKAQVKQLLFYDKPTPLMVDKHAEAGLSPEVDYSFSKETNSVPILHTEFAEVAKHYPIVFAANDKADPVAIFSLEESKNSLVNKEGRWLKDKYIPAYVRRYPFAFMSGEGDQLILCVDEGSKFFQKKSKKKEQKFFDGKDQTKLTQNALKFCLQFHNEQLLTQKLTSQLLESGLLVDQQITVTSPQNKEKKFNLSGFKIVDAEKLRNLDAEKLKEWNQSGLLSLIYVHLMSLSNFSKFAA